MNPHDGSSYFLKIVLNIKLINRFLPIYCWYKCNRDRFFSVPASFIPDCLNFLQINTVVHFDYLSSKSGDKTKGGKKVSKLGEQTLVVI